MTFPEYENNGIGTKCINQDIDRLTGSC